MAETTLLNKIEENLSFFKKMYDAVRLIDPISKMVIDYKNPDFIKTNYLCYDYWNTGKVCDNCISIRAYLNNKCLIKQQQLEGKIMVVTAFPIENSQPVVLELLKNATESILIDNDLYMQGHLLQNIVCDLNNMIVRDKLSGLYNRRYVDEHLPADIIKGVLENHPVSVIFLDIDNLKEINDTYGHIYGDKTIKEISSIILQNISNTYDWAARYGGDEFFICLNNSDDNKAYETAEKIRTGINVLNISLNGNNLSTTVSLGVITLNNNILSADEVVSLVDQRMYKAKKSGKNKTINY